MKQPELGRMITQIRKEKGFTQEELVEKCNISVRTIQRIEAGEVTPRSYTVKTILAVLGYDLAKIKNDYPETEIFDFQDAGFNKLRWAFYAGIVYFFVGFVEFYIDADLEFFQTLNISSSFYIGLKALSLLSMLLFYIGFAISGSVFNNYLLKMSAVLIIAISAIAIGFDVYYWFYTSDSEMYFAIVFSIAIGSAYMLHGIGVMRLKKYLGTNLSAVTGLVLIVVGFSLVTVVLFIFGLFLLIPLNILQLVLLYKIMEFAKPSLHNNLTAALFFCDKVVST